MEAPKRKRAGLFHCSSSARKRAIERPALPSPAVAGLFIFGVHMPLRPKVVAKDIKAIGDFSGSAARARLAHSNQPVGQAAVISDDKAGVSKPKPKPKAKAKPKSKAKPKPKRKGK
jgi:hypothetical protein